MGQTEHHLRDALGKLVNPDKWSGLFLLGSGPWGKAKESSDHPYRPAGAAHSGLTSSPIVPAILFLSVALLLLSSTPVQQWLAGGGNFPTFSRIFAVFSKEKKPTTLPDAGSDVIVWTKKQAGFYYCQGGTLFASSPGEFMTQIDALTSGYRPGAGQYCTNDRPLEASLGSSYSRLQHWLGFSAGNLPGAGKLSTLFQKKQSALAPPEGAERVVVWANQQSGFYYCQGGVMFSSKPGELMTQADALMSGYRPFGDQFCANDKSRSASAYNLSSVMPSGVK